MPRTSMIHGPQPAPTAADSPDAVQALLRAAAEFPSAGVRTPAGLLTYPELLDRARRILTGLRTREAVSGHHVILHGLALDAFFPAFWACLLGGMRPAVISDAAAEERLRHTWELLDSPLILTDRARLDLATVAVDDLAQLEPAEELYQPDPAEVAVVMLSSGSTGAPKAAALTHQALAEFAAGSRLLLDLRPGETMLNWLPVDHSGALLLYHVLPVFAGATGVHLPTNDVLANPLLWLQEVDRYEVQHTWSPTFGLQLVADALPVGASLDLSSVRSLVCGGEQIVLPVLDRFFAATAGSGLDRACLRPAWGMAETTTAITFGRLTDEGSVVRVLKSSLDSVLVPAGPESDCLTFVAVGSPAPGASIRVVDENDEVLPELRIGRLQVRSNRVTTGYVNNESATAAALPDGEWLRTGDLAFVSGGQVVITGREGETVVVNGNTVFCHEIEGVAAGVDGVGVHAVGACGVPNAETGTEDLVVFVEADDAVAPAVRALIFERLRLAAEVVAVPAGEFPRTASGKVRRNELRQRYLSGQYGVRDNAAASTAGPRAGTRSRVPSAARTELAESRGSSVRAVAAEVSRLVAELAGQPTADDVPFYELGLTSIKLTRLRAMLSERFGIEVPATVPFEYPTAAALTGWLAEAAPVSRAGAEADGVDRRVAVVGMAARFPGARTIDEFWANLCGGVDSVSTGPGADGWVRAGGVLDDVEAFDVEFFGMSPKEAALTEPAHRQFLEVAHQALEHGGYAGSDASGLRIGVYAGSGMNLYGHQDLLDPSPGNDREDRARDGRRGVVGVGDVPTAMQATIGAAPDFLASRAAYRLGLTGPAIGVQTACSTSLVAVHLAVQALLTSDTDLAIAGAAAVRLPQDAGYQYVPGSILSRSGRCRPFDADADGTVGGNGVAAVLLKRLDRALADGDTIHAVILGSAVNNDGTSKVGFTAPSVSGQADVVRQALERAGVGAETISYVEAHGTGTALGDPIEFAALSQVFGSPDDRTAKCGLGSVKANVGHLDSCAGMAGLIKTILMLQHARLVPTINLTRPHPELRIENSPFELITTTRDWPESAGPRRAGVTALGVGGTNAHIILEQPPRTTTPKGLTEWTERGRSAAGEPVVVPVSARSRAALEELVGLLRDQLVARPDLVPADVATTLALGRRHHQHRVAVVGADATSLAAALAQATPSEPGRPGPLGFAYSGQGASYPGMSAWLATRFDAARRVFDEVTQLLGEDIVDAQQEELAQVSLFANQVAWTEVWRALGVLPDVVIGHSVGEYAALYAAGALSLRDGVRLTVRRGELMRTRMRPGAMIAVAADRTTADKLAAECGLEVAAVNGPDRFVLAGSEDAAAGAAEILDRLGVSWRRMPVDRAFHSVLVEPVLDDLRAAANEVTFQPLRLPFFSGLDGSLLTHVTSHYVVDHARRPVRFDLATTAAAEFGATRFLELGPDTVLTPLGRRAAPGTTWLPTQRRGSTTQFPETVATLYRTGTNLTWQPLSTAHRIPLPGHPLTRRPIPTHPFTPPTPTATPSTPTGTAIPPAAAGSAVPAAGTAGMPAAVGTAGLSDAAGTAFPPAAVGAADLPAAVAAANSPVPAGTTVPPVDVGTAGPPAAVGITGLPVAAESADLSAARGGALLPVAVGTASLRAAEGSGRPPVSAGAGVLGTVRELIAPALGMVPNEIPADVSFLSLGADSLSLMRLVGDLTDTFGVTVSVRSLFSDVDTPAKLADLIANSTTTPPQPLTSSTPTPPGSAGLPGAPAAGVVAGAQGAAVVPGAPGPSVVLGASGTGVVLGAPAAGVVQGAPGSGVMPGASGTAGVPGPPPVDVAQGAPGSGVVAGGAGSGVVPGAPGIAGAPSAGVVPGWPGAASSVVSSAGSLQEVVERQLQVAERMVDRVTNLMSEQLALLNGALGSGPQLTAAPAAMPTSTPAAASASAVAGVPAVAGGPELAGTSAVAGVPATAGAPEVAGTSGVDGGPAARGASAVDSAPEVAMASAVVGAPAVGGESLAVGSRRKLLGRSGSVGAGRRGGCDFSLYFFGDYPDSAARDKYGLIVGATEFADQRGFHSVWLPERHFHSFGALFPNPSVLAAALATRTRNIRLNAGSVVLPLHHPIRVAEEWSVVDNLSGGRVGLCIASGWHARDFVLAPDAYGNHRTEMYDRLDTVRRLWAGEAITAVAGNGEPTEVRLHPSPLQDEPPLFTAVVGNPESYKLAARNGLGVVTNLMAQSVEDLAANIALYRSTRAEHGLDPDAGRVVVLLHTYVGDDLETVRAEAYQPFCDYLRSSLSLFGQVTNSLGFQIDLEKTAPDDVDFLLGQAYRRYCETRALIGTPDTCRAIVDQLIAIGANELACFVDFGLGPDDVMRSLAAVDELRAEYVEQPSDAGRTGDEPGDDGRPLTPPEKRIWFLEQLNPGANTYHEPKAIELRGPLDPAALQGALQRVVDRHPALRTEFREVDGEPRAFVRTEVRIECPVVDAEGNDIESLLHDVRLGALDLDTAPLLRARLVRLADDHHVLLLVGHHIVFDSASTPIVVRDLGAYYRAWPADPGLPPAVDGLPPAVDGLSQRPHSSAEDRDFWLAELADAPELRLPTDRPRPRTWSGAGRSLTHELDTSRLGAFAASSGVTVFSVLLAGLGVVLSRFSGQRDFVIGTGVSGRGRSAAESVGMFVDTFPLRIRLAEDADFPGLARSLGLSLMDAVDHGDVPFEDIVAELNPDRSTGRNPLFGVAVEFENGVDKLDFAPGLEVNLRDLPSDRAPVDLLLYLSYTPSGVRCVVEYDSDLFDESTVQRLLDYLELTLELATAAPSVPVRALSDLTAADEQLLAGFEGEPGPASSACLHELFEQRVDLHPDAIAVDGDFGQVTYGELDRRANRVAIELLWNGVQRGELVGSCLPRGVDQLAVLLGVLKSGAGYLALDPAVPVERLRFQLNDSGATVLVTGDGMPDLGDLPTILVDHLDPVAADRPRVEVTPDDLAYCFYTSGSSGTPKGVLMPHRGPVNNLLGFATHPLTTLQWASSMFDMSLHETFTTFITGQTLILIEDASRYDPEQLARRIREHRIQRIVMPFSAVHALLATRPELPSLRVICSAGEATTPTAVEHAFLAAHPDCVLYNGYGPTETSIGVTDHPVEPGETVPPIGRPLPGVRIRLLDPDRRPVPAGAVGEICIGGVCVADGYLNRPEETAKAFYAPGWYASGDLGRWRADGALEYLGRIDDQVQLRGVRVEPGEVRAAVQGHPAVSEAAVVVLDGELVGYTVGAVDHEELMEYLAARLPRYLVPRRWVSLERLPLTTTGKLDQAALAAPVAVEANVPPATPLESTIHAVWCEVLERAEIGVTDSFFDLGGHSLLAVRLLNRLRDATGLELTLSEFFRSPTIRAVASRNEPAPADPAPAEVEPVEVAPLTVAQRRCLELVRSRADASIYNTPARVDIHEELDPERLRHALERLVQRHSALRTRILDDRQEVLASVEVELPVEDLPADEDQIHAWCVATARPALEPSQAPLWRARLGRVSADHWVLVVAIHHLVFDGWSARLFWDELSALYGGTELPPPSAQHTDYARWEHDTLTGVTRAELDGFWRAELAGSTVEPALPVDHPRPATLSGRGATQHVELPESLAKEVRTAAASAGTTPYVLIAAAFAEWLGALCGHDEVVLPVSSARRRQSGHEGIIGFIGEAVPVRIRLGTHDLLAETARAVYSALDHEALPWGEILRTVLPDQTQAILFTVITTPAATLSLPTGSYPVRALPSPDLARRELYVVFTLTDTSFTLDIEYSTDLFTAATITEWSTTLVAALANRCQV